MKELVRPTACFGRSLRRTLSAWLAILSATACCAPVLAVDKAPTPPTWVAVEKAVHDYFSSLRDYRPGDLISQGNFDAIAAQLATLGWTPSEASKIRGALLAEKSFLVTELRTKDGRAFMRQVGGYALGFDRLDHLSEMPTGKSAVRRLIAGPDGYKLLEYMSTTPGGAELDRMLTNSDSGKDFNKVTGRIYTADRLLKRLRTNFASDTERKTPTTAGRSSSTSATVG